MTNVVKENQLISGIPLLAQLDRMAHRYQLVVTPMEYCRGNRTILKCFAGIEVDSAEKMGDQREKVSELARLSVPYSSPTWRIFLSRIEAE